MKQQGMVYALEEIHRLLKPGGIMVDIHPVPQSTLIRIFRHGELLFEEPAVVTGWEDVIRAERALGEVADRGLFVLDKADEFDIHAYASSVGELQTYLELMDAFDDSPLDEAVAWRAEEQATRVEKILRKSGDGAEVAYYEKGRMARMRPVK